MHLKGGLVHVVKHSFSPSTCEVEEGRFFCEYKASLVYIVSSRSAGATKWDPTSETNKERTTDKMVWQLSAVFSVIQWGRQQGRKWASLVLTNFSVSLLRYKMSKDSSPRCGTRTYVGLTRLLLCWKTVWLLEVNNTLIQVAGFLTTVATALVLIASAWMQFSLK